MSSEIYFVATKKLQEDGGAMTTADWALVISLFSTVISLCSLGWNVWSKFIYPKPVLRVGFSLMGFIGDGPWRDPFLNLSITNHGPIECTITHVFLEALKVPPGKKFRGLINPLRNIAISIEATDGPFTNLPRTLKVGESFSLHFWCGESSWMREEVLRVGVADSFNRDHWCSQKDVKRVQQEFFKLRDEGKLQKSPDDLRG